MWPGGAAVVWSDRVSDGCPDGGALIMILGYRPHVKMLHFYVLQFKPHHKSSNTTFKNVKYAKKSFAFHCIHYMELSFSADALGFNTSGWPDICICICICICFCVRNVLGILLQLHWFFNRSGRPDVRNGGRPPNYNGLDTQDWFLLIWEEGRGLNPGMSSRIWEGQGEYFSG